MEKSSNWNLRHKRNINSLNQLASNYVRANATEDSTGFHIEKQRDHSLTPLRDSSNLSLIYQMCLRYRIYSIKRRPRSNAADGRKITNKRSPRINAAPNQKNATLTRG